MTGAMVLGHGRDVRVINSNGERLFSEGENNRCLLEESLGLNLEATCISRRCSLRLD